MNKQKFLYDIQLIVMAGIWVNAWYSYGDSFSWLWLFKLIFASLFILLLLYVKHDVSLGDKE